MYLVRCGFLKISKKTKLTNHIYITRLQAGFFRVTHDELMQAKEELLVH